MILEYATIYDPIQLCRCAPVRKFVDLHLPTANGEAHELYPLHDCLRIIDPYLPLFLISRQLTSEMSLVKLHKLDLKYHDFHCYQ